MIRPIVRFSLFLVLLATLCAAMGAYAQVPSIDGIGLSAQPFVRDTVITEGSYLWVVSTYRGGTEWKVRGVGLDPDSLNQVLLHLYVNDTPRDNPILTMHVQVDTTSYFVDTVLVPHRIRYRLTMPAITNGSIRSVQLEMGLLARDTLSNMALSERRTSFIPVGRTPQVLSNVDAFHVPYLTIEDVVTHPPVILAPRAGSVVGRYFNVDFLQPEDADSGTLRLSFRNLDNTLEAAHTLVLSTLSADSNKTVNLDAGSLFNRGEMDTVYGGNALANLAHYRIVVSYRDINGNGAATDTVAPVQVDWQTVPPVLYEPRLGSSQPDSSVLVAYELPEIADTVWITFAMDSFSEVRDPLSPHILRLVPSLNSPGLVSFHLDGTRIGSGGTYVAESNNGTEDRLVPRTVYNVTMTYGDTLGNNNVSVTNNGYVWPRDLATIPPRILFPNQDTTRVSDRIPFRVLIPEPPLRGSIRLMFTSRPDTSGLTDPGSPHILYLQDLPVGQTVFYVTGTQLSYSELVDSVHGSGSFEQNNTLLNLHYLLRLFYQDSLGNPADTSTNFTMIFDTYTYPPRIISPHDGDSLARSGMPVTFDQPETALPGSARVILTQTGGPAQDDGSPHTLILSGKVRGLRTMTIQPLSLVASSGVDSIRGGNSLVSRGVYRLSIEYRDTLFNPPSSDEISNLLMPSGTTVFVSGTPMGTGIIVPGDTTYLAFRLDLHTLGGQSVLRGARFSVEGTVLPEEIVPRQVRLWNSVDTVFSPAFDPIVDSLRGWSGVEIRFDSFATALTEEDTHFFVTLSFPEAANSSHTMSLIMWAPNSLDCGGDPVFAQRWPIGGEDIALSAMVTSFVTVQDTAFGSLQVMWTVASETNNAGFILSRHTDGEEEGFQIIATWRDHAELVGRGTAPSATRYMITDRGLQPGRRYVYHLAAENESFHVVQFDSTMEAVGIPRVPPHDFVLRDAYPNPFNQDVTISYVVPYTSKVTIVVYDLLGRQVRTLVNALQAPSDYRARWDSRNDQGVIVPSGVYLYRMQAGNTFQKTRKLLLVR